MDHRRQPIMTDDPFTLRQAAIVAALAADAVLATIPTVSEDPGDPEAGALVAIANGALPANAAGRTGIAIIVRTIELPGAEETRSTLLLVTATFQIWIRENVPINRDPAAGIGVSSLRAVYRALKAVHGLSYGLATVPPTPTSLLTPPAGGANQLLRFTSGASSQTSDSATLDWFLDFAWGIAL